MSRRAAVDLSRSRVPVGVGWALALAAVAGPLLSAAFPESAIWPFAPIAIACVLVALRGRGFWSGTGVGLVFGVGFWFTLIPWVGEFLGIVPVVALAGLQSVYVALGCGLLAIVWRVVPRAFPSTLGRVVVLPLVLAGVWLAREVVSNTWPYAGFAWGRVSITQAEGPLRHLFPWLGASGVSFVLVAVVAFAVCLAVERARALPTRPSAAALERPRPAALLVVAVVVALLAVPAWTPQVFGLLRVAGVQAVTPSGFFEPSDYRGQVLEENALATLQGLAAAQEAGTPPQLVVWPEGSADVDPVTDGDAASLVTQVTELAEVPLILGTIREKHGRIFNSSILWRPGSGPSATEYDKRRPVPFGEYIPDRAFWTPFAPELLGQVTREYTPGTTSPVFDIGEYRVAMNICFDIVDDALIRESVRDGGEIIIAQTNNADFGQTEESVQQLAIARMRALETARSVVSVSTVAATAIIGPSGETLMEIPAFEEGVLLGDAPLARGTTPAVAVGAQLEQALTVLPLTLVLALLLPGPLRRSRG